LIGATGTLTILSGLHVFTAVDWTEFDQLRNRLLQAGTTVMVMPLKTLGLLQDLAPNLSSWLGGRVWRWDESAAALSPPEIEARLMTLRAWSGKSDDARDPRPLHPRAHLAREAALDLNPPSNIVRQSPSAKHAADLKGQQVLLRHPAPDILAP